MSRTSFNGEYYTTSRDYRFHDGAQRFLRTSQSGSTQEWTVWGPTPDEVIARQTSPAWQYFHQDQINSVFAVTNASGTVLERYLYDPFGLPDVRTASWGNRGSTAINNPWTFTGQEWQHDLSISNYKARWYQPTLGRFLQNDPVRFDAGDLNLYRYCGNDPVNSTDPSGTVIRFTSGSDVQSAIKAWKFVTKDNPEAKAKFEALGRSPETTTIDARIGVENMTDPSRNEISWDPSVAPLNSRGEVMSPARVLYHEVDHQERNLRDPSGQQTDGETPIKDYGNVEEMRVIRGSEARGAEIRGEPQRYDHRNHGFKKVKDVTEHTKTESKEREKSSSR